MLNRLVRGLMRHPGEPRAEAETANPASPAPSPESEIVSTEESDVSFISRALAGVEVEAEQTIDFSDLPEDVRAEFERMRKR